VLVSPYLRAIQTARLICEAAEIEVNRADGSYVVDERLREKEFGVLTGLTRAGMASLHPDEYALRMLFGKFYHRPPRRRIVLRRHHAAAQSAWHGHPRVRCRRPRARGLSLGGGDLLPLLAGADE